MLRKFKERLITNALHFIWSLKNYNTPVSIRVLCILKGQFAASFSLISCFRYSWQYKVWRWLDSNRGPQLLEATALPTDPQPLSIINVLCFYCQVRCLIHPFKCSRHVSINAPFSNICFNNKKHCQNVLKPNLFGSFHSVLLTSK